MPMQTLLESLAFTSLPKARTKLRVGPEDVDAGVVTVADRELPVGAALDVEWAPHRSGRVGDPPWDAGRRADVLAGPADVHPEGANERARGGEDVDPVVVAVGDVEKAAGAEVQPPGPVHRPGLAAYRSRLTGGGADVAAVGRVDALAEGADEDAGLGEDIDPLVGFGGDVEQAIWADRDVFGQDDRSPHTVDEALLAPGADRADVASVERIHPPAERPQEDAGSREDIDPVVEEIGDEDRAVGADRETGRHPHLARRFTLGAEARERAEGKRASRRRHRKDAGGGGDGQKRKDDLLRPGAVSRSSVNFT